MFGHLPSFSLFSFFQLEHFCFPCKSQKKLEKEHLLQDLQKWEKQKSFANVWIGWNPSALFVKALVQEPLQGVDAEYRKGDSLELFFDTRDLKSKNYFTKFCHHFVFFPEPIDDIWAKEVTRFHGEDVHPLCRSEDLEVEVVTEKNSYQIFVKISDTALFGFDPSKFDRLGFSYRINRFQKDPQVFATPTEEFHQEKNPSLWPTLVLKKEAL